jgi:hypothetical protein
MDLQEIVVSLSSFSDFKQSCRATYLFRNFARISWLLLRGKTKKKKNFGENERW